MRILNINSYHQNFKSSCRNYHNPKLEHSIITNGLISNYTELFRPDMNWIELIKVIEDNFKNTEKVNTYCLACSDGSETYSTIIGLKEYGEDADKYFPIISIDNDPVVIESALSRRINLTQDDFKRLGKNVDSEAKYFTDKKKRMLMPDESPSEYMTFYMNSYKPSKCLRENAIFLNGDILETIQELQDEGNTLIFCRNVMPYLTNTYQMNLFNTLLKKLKPGSIFIAGGFDRSTILANSLEFHSLEGNIHKNFQKLMNNVYKRI